MARYVQLEIDQIRRDTRQTVSAESNSNQEGIDRETILEFINEAEDRITQIILENCPNVSYFDSTSIVSCVAGQAKYALPDSAFLDGSVSKVEYSYNGDARYYHPLRLGSLIEMDTYQSYTPVKYQVSPGYVSITPVPQSSQGTLRITFTERVPRLDIRRGKVKSVAMDGTSTYYVTLELENDSWLEETLFDSFNYLCVVNRDGAIQHVNLEYDSWNSVTKTFTLASGQLVSTGTITAGDYIVLDRYRSSHSQLPDHCDVYRKQYTALRVKAHASNTDFAEYLKFLTGQEELLVGRFQAMVKGARGIPIINKTWV